MSREPRAFLEDMLESCRRVLRYTDGMSQEALIADEIVYDASLRNLEIIGEAAKRVPADVARRFRRLNGRRSQECETGSLTAISA